MTATPIPRTVAMTVYGDLEVSALRELPGGRSPIATTVVPAGEKPAWLERVWSRIREEVAAGHQVYVVCPRVGGDTGKGGGVPGRPGLRSRRSRGGPGRAARPARRARREAEAGGGAARRPAARRPAREAAAGREGRRDAGVRRRRHRRPRRHHGRRGGCGRAELDGDGDPRRGPVRAVPAAPAARAGGPRLGARGVPAGDGRAGGHHGARASGRGGEHHGRVRAGPDGPRAAPGG
jgi:hypothetical protein